MARASNSQMPSRPQGPVQTASRSGGGDDAGPGAAGLAENPGWMVPAKEAPARDSPCATTSATTGEKGQGPTACGLSQPQEPTHEEGVPTGKPPESWGGGVAASSRRLGHPPSNGMWSVLASHPNQAVPSNGRASPPLPVPGALQPQQGARSPSLGGIKEAKEGFLH